MMMRLQLVCLTNTVTVPCGMPLRSTSRCHLRGDLVGAFALGGDGEKGGMDLHDRANLSLPARVVDGARMFRLLRPR